MSRFPRSLYGRGEEPDPRFSLANERTFLAWIRTSLALIAAGVAVYAIELPMPPVLRTITAILFIALGFLAAGQSWWGWFRAERSLRQNTPLAGPTLAPVLTVGILAGVVIVVVGFFL